LPFSTMWALIIMVAAFTAAAANILFLNAKDQERTQAASEKALSIIKGECENNLTIIGAMRDAFKMNRYPVNGLEVTAWNIVSSGGLLVQVDKDTLAKVANIYYIVGLANAHQARLLELNYGVAAAMQNAAQSRQEQVQFITNNIDALEPKLKELIALIK
jgi:uncharacterized protein YpmB